MAIKVMHYYTYPENSGGPLTYIKNIMNSKYFPHVEFKACFQGKPISQVRPKDIKRIVEEIKAFSPDILQVHGVQSEGVLGVFVGKRAGVPKILMTVHGIQIDAQNISSIKKSFFKYIAEPYALRNSDAVYCVCDAMASREFIKNNSKKLLPTIHNFITDDFVNKEICEDSFKDSTSKTIVVTVGRVSVDKGMVELEKCIRSTKNTDVQYWIIGSGDYEEKMKFNLSNEIKQNKVVFWGQQENVKMFLNKADVFLFLSHHENLSIALLEAASQKCCCIVTSVGGNTEIVSHEIDGLIVPPCDPNSAKQALEAVLDDKARCSKFGEEISKKIRVNFDEKTFSTKLNSVYLNLLERKNK